MNSSQIACFLQAAKKLSFTETASDLFLSPQAVSKQVAALEDDLSARLFERNGPHLRLTDTGEMYVKLFSGRERQLRFMTEDMRRHRQSMALELRIGVSEWLYPAGDFGQGLDDFRREYPSCHLSVRVCTNGELITALKNSALDCGFFSGAQCPQHRNLLSCPVGREHMMLYAPSDLGEGPARQDCWGLPLLLVPAWDWSFTELKVVGAREATGVKLSPAGTMVLPNLSSMYAQMEFSRCATLGGDRFNYFARIPGLTPHPTGQTDDIFCLWERESPHPLMDNLTATLQASFGYDVNAEPIE